jgi:hypothetical protein
MSGNKTVGNNITGDKLSGNRVGGDRVGGDKIIGANNNIGSAIAWLIFVMLAASVVGTSVVKLGNVSSYAWASKNINTTALYNGESGGRYVASLIQTDITNGNWVNTDKMHGKTFNLDTGSFVVTIDKTGGGNPNYVLITIHGKMYAGTPSESDRTVVIKLPNSSAPGNLPGFPPDSFNPPAIPNDDQPDPNWMANSNPLVHGDYLIESAPTGGGAALEFGHSGGSGSDLFVLPAAGNLNSALAALWALGNGLTYDEQVKILVDSNINYAAGMYFRRHPNQAGDGTNTSFGVSFIHLINYNDSNMDGYSCNPVSPCTQTSGTHILNTTSTYLVFWKDTAGGSSGFRTIAYYQLPASMNTLPYWTTVLVRIKETTPPTGCSIHNSDGKVNVIQVYYSTNATATGDANPTNTARIGNLRGSVNWPAIAGGTNSGNDYFTLVSWAGVGSAQTGGTGAGWSASTYQFINIEDAALYGANTGICTTENRSNNASYAGQPESTPYTPFPPEVALAALGNNVQNKVWLDDFAVGTGGTGAGGSTVVYYP